MGAAPQTSASALLHRVLAYWRAFAVAAFALGPVPAHGNPAISADPQAEPCPDFLMAFECKDFYRRLSKAHSARECAAIRHAYANIIADRRDACLCTRDLKFGVKDDPMRSLGTCPATREAVDRRSACGGPLNRRTIRPTTGAS
jgi:hypothetical protein